MLAFDVYPPNKFIRGKARRGHGSVHGTLRSVDETSTAALGASAVPQRQGFSRGVLCLWGRPTAVHEAVAAAADDGTTSKSELDHLEERVRKLASQLGLKALKVDFLKEPLSKSRANRLALPTRSPLIRGSR